MNINNTDSDASQNVSESAANESADRSTSQKQDQDAYKNLKGEFSRKLSKMNDQIAQLTNAVLAGKQSGSSQELADEAVTNKSDAKRYVNEAFREEKQKTALDEAYRMFPEMNPNSDEYDDEFYKQVDAEFSLNLKNDPRGPLKAAQLVALQQGKIEQLTRANLIKDEARRSRILSEGGSQTREAKKAEKDPSSSFNTKNLARLGINSDKLAKRMKANKEKYEGL